MVIRYRRLIFWGVKDVLPEKFLYDKFHQGFIVVVSTLNFTLPLSHTHFTCGVLLILLHKFDHDKNS